MNLNTGIVPPPKSIETKTAEVPEDQRKPVIHCALIRIMKARKYMDQQQLAAEAIGQLSGRFIPSERFMKVVANLAIL